MSSVSIRFIPLLLTVATLCTVGSALADTAENAVQELIRSVHTAAEQALLQEIYIDNPEIAAARARVRQFAERAPQARSLPDPTLSVAAFLLPPETRAGPQRLSATIGQHLPRRGKLSLREDIEFARTEEARCLSEKMALAKISQARRLLARLAFIDASMEIVREDLDVLEEFEQLARTRYATGRGAAQSPVKLQAEITINQALLLKLDSERAALVARLNSLRNRPGSKELPPLTLPTPLPAFPTVRELRLLIVNRHPAVGAASQVLRAAETKVALARKDYRPDFTVGLTYTFVDRRQDPAGRVSPLHDDGDDVLGIAATINLPIHKRRLDAGVREAAERRTAAAKTLESTILSLERTLQDRLAQHVPLYDQWNLLRRVLLPQAEESLASARFAYETGRSSILDLLDAERVLLEVRLGAKRAAMQVQLLVIDVEDVIAGPWIFADHRESQQ